MISRHGRILGALCVSATLLAGCGGAQSRYASHMERGQELYKKEDYAKAGVEFRNALQIVPRDPKASVMAGHVAERLGKARDAAGLYQFIVDTDPQNLEARISLARLLVLSDLPQKALETLAPGFTAHPDDADLLTWRGAAKLRMNDVAGARADAERALQIVPANEDAVSLRAGLYQREGKLADAANLLESASQHAPSSTMLHEALLQLYATNSEMPKAQQQLEALIKLRPDETRYRYQLAQLYSSTSKLDDAQRTLQEIVKAHPDDDDAKLTLVNFLFNRRSPEEGEKALRAFIAEKPKAYNLQLALAQLFQHQGKVKEALQIYAEVREAAGTEPSGLMARTREAAVYVEQNKQDDALNLVGQVLQKNPRDTDALLLRGRVELKRGQGTSAISDFRAVLRDQPHSAVVLDLLAQAYMFNGEAGLAEESLHAAADAAPTNTTLRIELADLLLETQRGDKAAAVLTEAVQKAPSDPAVRTALVRTYLANRDPQHARDAVDGLKQLQPDSATAFYLSGLVAQAQNRPDDSARDLQRALQLKPDAIDPLTALVRLDLSRGHPDQAIKLVQAASERSPQSAAPLNLLGETYLAAKDNAHAQESFNRAIAIAPKWAAPYRNLAVAKLAVRDSAGALAAYQSAVQAAPADPTLVIEIASLYERTGQIDQAIAQYDAFLKSNFRPVVANNMAMLLVNNRKDQHDLDRARDLTAGFTSSENGDFLDTTGWVHFKRGEYADAVRVLARAAERVPDSKVIRYHLGMAELQTGQRDRARSDLEAAVAGSATYTGVDEARSTLADLKRHAAG